MISRENFDADMTYWKTLRIVARGLIQWPIDRYEWDEFVESLEDTLYYGCKPFAKFTAMLLLPLSAPLFAWLVQIERKRIAAAKEAAKQKMKDRFSPTAGVKP